MASPTTARSRLAIPILLLLGATLGCGGDDPFGGDDTPRRTANSVVTYWATGTGGVTVTSITYRDEAGAEVTETNPFLPWTKRFEGTSGRQVSLAAQVTVNTSGSAEIRMTVSAPANVDERVSRSATKPVAFALTIPAVTLP